MTIEIVGGVRGGEEIAACKQEHLVDLIAWIDNDRMPKDSTVGFVERKSGGVPPPSATAGMLCKPADEDVTEATVGVMAAYC
jgi:hypothetical protein